LVWATTQKGVTVHDGFNFSRVKRGAVPGFRPAAVKVFLNKGAERLKATLQRIGKVDCGRGGRQRFQIPKFFMAGSG
jgi:hypothetical protein